MIQIFDSEQKSLGLFKDYDAVYQHITALENSKLLDSSTYPNDIWAFVLFTNKRLSYIYHKTLERSFSKVGREAFERELDLLEISKGDYHNPIQIPVTGDVDISELKRTWCQEYCDSHDMSLIEYDANFDVSTLVGHNIPANCTAHSHLDNEETTYRYAIH